MYIGRYGNILLYVGGEAIARSGTLREGAAFPPENSVASHDNFVWGSRCQAPAIFGTRFPRLRKTQCSKFLTSGRPGVMYVSAA